MTNKYTDFLTAEVFLLFICHITETTNMTTQLEIQDTKQNNSSAYLRHIDTA